MEKKSLIKLLAVVSSPGSAGACFFLPKTSKSASISRISILFLKRGLRVWGMQQISKKKYLQVLYPPQYFLTTKLEETNPAYGRHQISRPMRIVAPKPKRTELDRKNSHREAGSLTERPCLSQRHEACHREALPVTERPCLSQRGHTSHREVMPLT